MHLSLLGSGGESGIRRSLQRPSQDIIHPCIFLFYYYFFTLFFLQVRTNVPCVNALTQQESGKNTGVVTPEQGIQPRRSKRLKKPPLWQKDYIMY